MSEASGGNQTLSTQLLVIRAVRVHEPVCNYVPTYIQWYILILLWGAEGRHGTARVQRCLQSGVLYCLACRGLANSIHRSRDRAAHLFARLPYWRCIAIDLAAIAPRHLQTLLENTPSSHNDVTQRLRMRTMRTKSHFYRRVFDIKTLVKHTRVYTWSATFYNCVPNICIKTAVSKVMPA